MQPGVPKLVYQLPQVSILYEANEVCNRRLGLLVKGLEALFQSSTRLTRFATPRFGAQSFAGRTVSILYEANEVCNGRTTLAAIPAQRGQSSTRLTRVAYSRRLPLFQSSTRLTRFATSTPWLLGHEPHVSILYEANEVCNWARSSPR